MSRVEITALYRFRFLGKKKPEEHSMCVGDCKDTGRDQDTVSCGTDTASCGTDTISCVRTVVVPIRPVVVPIRSVTVPIRSVTVPIRSVTVPIRSVVVPIRPVVVPIRSVTVRMARRGFQHCVVHCLLPPTLVYFAVMQPGLFSVDCLIHCTTTKTPFSELPQAFC